MNMIGMAVLASWPNPNGSSNPTQLTVEIHPLPDPQVIEELAATHPTKLIAGKLTLLLAEIVPESHEGKEIGPFDLEPVV